jgi:hypothetical protein
MVNKLQINGNKLEILATIVTSLRTWISPLKVLIRRTSLPLSPLFPREEKKERGRGGDKRRENEGEG